MLNNRAAVDHVRAEQESYPRTGEIGLYMTAFDSVNVEIHSHAVEFEAGDPHKAAAEGDTDLPPGAIRSATSLYRYPNGHRLGSAS